MSGPSFSNGFASPWYGGELKYPRLWRGCVSAWAPRLGPTGGQLFDQSGFCRHGTLTNMDPATDWLVDGCGYYLDFDGSDDHVVASPPGVFTGNHTIAMWFLFNSVANRITLVSQLGSHINAYHLLMRETGPQLEFMINNDIIIAHSFSSILTWHHLGVTREGNQWTLYVDGSQVGTASKVSPNSLTGDLFFGQRNDGFHPLDGRLDDIAIWDRTLTDEEILTLSGFGGNHRIGRGIMYELNDDPIAAAVAAAGNRRRRLLLAC